MSDIVTSDERAKKLAHSKGYDPSSFEALNALGGYGTRDGEYLKPVTPAYTSDAAKFDDVSSHALAFGEKLPNKPVKTSAGRSFVRAAKEGAVNAVAFPGQLAARALGASPKTLRDMSAEQLFESLSDEDAADYRYTRNLERQQHPVATEIGSDVGDVAGGALSGSAAKGALTPAARAAFAQEARVLAGLEGGKAGQRGVLQLPFTPGRFTQRTAVQRTEDLAALRGKHEAVRSERAADAAAAHDRMLARLREQGVTEGASAQQLSALADRANEAAQALKAELQPQFMEESGLKNARNKGRPFDADRLRALEDLAAKQRNASDLILASQRAQELDYSQRPGRKALEDLTSRESAAEYRELKAKGGPRQAKLDDAEAYRFQELEGIVSQIGAEKKDFYAARNQRRKAEKLPKLKPPKGVFEKESR
jgi:hypothetical protein